MGIIKRRLTTAKEAAEIMKFFLKGKALEIRKSSTNLDGTKTVTLDNEGKIHIWDSKTGDLIITVSGTYIGESNEPLILFSETGNAVSITDQEWTKTIYFSNPPVEVKRPRKR